MTGEQPRRESYVDHEVLKAFAENKVNVPKEEAKGRRRQVNCLREQLEDYIAVPLLPSSGLRPGEAPRVRQYGQAHSDPSQGRHRA